MFLQKKFMEVEFVIQNCWRNTPAESSFEEGILYTFWKSRRIQSPFRLNSLSTFHKWPMDTLKFLWSVQRRAYNSKNKEIVASFPTFNFWVSHHYQIPTNHYKSMKTALLQEVTAHHGVAEESHNLTFSIQIEHDRFTKNPPAHNSLLLHFKKIIGAKTHFTQRGAQKCFIPFVNGKKPPLWH